MDGIEDDENILPTEGDDNELENDTGGEMKQDGEDSGKAMEDVDAELENMKRRVKEMEEEAEKLRAISQVDKEMTPAAAAANKEEADARSIYVGSVDYGATPEDLQAHFQSCGTINRVTILCDKFTGHPKGYAYIEFLDIDSVANAMLLNESLFRGRQIKVSPKRTNLPGMALGRGGAPYFPRGRGGFRRPYAYGGFPPRGRGMSRGGFRGRPPYYHPYAY